VKTAAGCFFFVVLKETGYFMELGAREVWLIQPEMAECESNHGAHTDDAPHCLSSCMAYAFVNTAFVLKALVKRNL
jgi:hypothetical protein